MAKFYPELTPPLQTFIAQQHLFFTATAAPESIESGRINLSPKGIDSFRVLDPRQVAYLDVTGSGNETSAHLQLNSRMTIMFCSLIEPPLILRIYGVGRVVRPRDADWDAMLAHFVPVAGMRQIVTVQVQSVQTSCGMGVPLYDYVGERESLIRWAEKKGEAGLREYRAEKNQVSIDGLPTHLLE
jgi:Pyridoxamine 5'-phosphate oxidase